jgi:3-oxoacyl-[acyl-carrier protein] reductase
VIWSYSFPALRYCKSAVIDVHYGQKQKLPPYGENPSRFALQIALRHNTGGNCHGYQPYQQNSPCHRSVPWHGRAIALALAAAGAHVIVHYGRNAEQAKAVVDEIRAADGQADQISSDLAAPDDPHALAERVRKLIGERLDILVLNAGISNATPFESMTVEEFDALFAVNVPAPYFLVQQFLPILGNGGNIVFLSSLGARAAVGTLSAYASTKGAVNTLVKYFATMLGPRGIRVNAVAPGVIDTDMSHFTKTEEGRTAVMGMQTLKRIGEPNDVASVVAFLASDDARWITGDTIAVDGGSRL